MKYCFTHTKLMRKTRKSTLNGPSTKRIYEIHHSVFYNTRHMRTGMYNH